MSPSEINQDPVQGEFFTAASDLPERLVRESIQNSLDARRDSEAVRVRFVFSGEQNALPRPKAAPYLEGLRRHVEAVVNAGEMLSTDVEAEAVEDVLACFDKPMAYLAIEDFGTKGLVGDTQSNREKEEGNDFWGFFRSIGISPKGEDAGGSWGLGKWVFPDASIINAYLGVTQRSRDEHRWLLMGMAILKTHRVAGEGDTKFRPYGSFADSSSERDEEWLPLPVEDDNAIQKVCLDFELSRVDGPGLSVILPYPKRALRPAAIARAVVTQYFLPIVRGDLVVEIVHPDEPRRIINADTIAEEVGGIRESERDDESPESLRRVIRLAERTAGLDAKAYVDLSSRAPEKLEGQLIEDLRQRYDEGNLLAFRVTMSVRPRTGRREALSSFRVYLERDDTLNNGHDYFIRGHLRIPRMDHIRRYKARALVLVDGNSSLGHMLRDAEGPAHSSWNPHAQRLKDRWVGGFQRVQDVRRLCVKLLQILTERPEEQDPFALADLFPSDPEAGRGPKPSRRPGIGKGPSPPEGLLKPPLPLAVSHISNGFSVRAGRLSGSVENRTWNLRFAYDVVRGNAFKQFESGKRQGVPDFTLHNGHLQVESVGGTTEVTGHNTMRLHIKEEGFRLTVTGFDERDIIVALNPVMEDAQNTVDDAA